MTITARRRFVRLASFVLLASCTSAGFAEDLSTGDASRIVAQTGQLRQHDALAVLKAGCGSFFSYPRAVGCYSAGIEEINDAPLNAAKGICGEIGGVSERTCYEKAMKNLSAPIFVDSVKTKELILKMCAASIDSDCFAGALAAAKGEFEPIAKKCATGYWSQPARKACFKTSLGG